MNYQREDLSIFDTHSQPGELEGTAYFELHPHELPEQYACWLQGSLFIKDAAFDFFVGCFTAANETFDYFSFQKFEAPQIALLVTEIEAYLSILEATPSRDEVFSRFESLFTQKIWADVSSDDIATAIRGCGVSILKFIEVNTSQSQVLWVLGM